MIHALKTLPEYFEAVRNGDKTFELRKNDRNFKVGDYLALNEWDGKKYTGRSQLVKVRYILDPNEVMNCAAGYVIMRIAPAPGVSSAVTNPFDNERKGGNKNAEQV
nr:MAG TPA: activating signal cointegrator [Podoviridae sp. ctJ6o53]